ncbi:MotE family protein [Massilibacterium senegalense]|uniref:MotE family protein n=1 Tax=Massilibacterium senegalense TaxID=1632858 RepID=UPI000783D70A|nr:hypothetical protein [Massilibacterium senegalense]
MSKKEQDEVEEFEALDEKKLTSGFKKFIVLVFIPIIFAIVVVIIFFSIIGVDVFGKIQNIASNIPGISKLVTDEKEQPSEKDKLKFQVEEQQAKINQLTKELEKKEKKVNELEQKSTQLEQEKQTLTQEQSANQEIQNMDTQKNIDADKELKDAAKTYSSMSSQKAADILTVMKREEAVLIMKQMRTDTRASILQKMEPVDAADFTKRLAEKGLEEGEIDNEGE